MMDPISNADRIALLLREKLKGKTPAARKERASTPQQARTTTGTSAISVIRNLDDRSLARAFIQDLLSEHFGGELINEAKFQRVVDRVVEAVEADIDGAKLLAKVIAELREAAR